MKSLLLIVLFSTGISYGQENGEAQRRQIISSFVEAVVNHKIEETISFMTPKYRDEQLKWFLKGNKVQFLDELFGGQDEISKEWLVVPFNSIIGLELVKIEIDEEELSWIVYFIVDDGKHLVHADLRLINWKGKKKGRIKYGFEGAYG